MDNKGQNSEVSVSRKQESSSSIDSFVLEKGIFSNIFEKDIRRVYIYKKAERLAKAIHLVSPAFRSSPSLRDRMDNVAVGLIDAAILPPMAARDGLSRELLALSSVLSIARTGGLLSSMNTELISREAHQLLQEVATYEEPLLFFDDAPTLAMLAKELQTDHQNSFEQRTSPNRLPKKPSNSKGQTVTAIKDKSNDRREAIRSILSNKGSCYIKDISTVIRDVSEKTIQRELQYMVDGGEVLKSGERRWTTYTLI